jgi:hypothetical protein
MHSTTQSGRTAWHESAGHAVAHLKDALKKGHDWPTAFFEAMALWTLPVETHQGRTYRYLLGGEAFDWLVLAERLCGEISGQIPQQEIEDLLLAGRLPESFDSERIQGLLGVDRYRGYLNFYYGVTVEEALQLANELEVLKRNTSNGILFVPDASQQAFARLYRDSGSALLARFRLEIGSTADADSISVGESREFTYWLFKYRLKSSDKSRIASDTRKGLQMLERMTSATGRRASRTGAGTNP